MGERPPAPNPNEPPAAAYPWRRKAEGDAIAPPPKRTCAAVWGVVEQCSADGSCCIAVFPGVQEKVLVYQQDMMGVPSPGLAIEARRRG